MFALRKRGSAAKHISWRESASEYTYYTLANGSYMCSGMCVALTLAWCTCELRPGKFYFCITCPGKRDPDRRLVGGGWWRWPAGGMLHSNPQPTHRRLLTPRQEANFSFPVSGCSRQCHFAQRRWRVIDGNGYIKLLLWCQANHFSRQLSSSARYFKLYICWAFVAEFSLQSYAFLLMKSEVLHFFPNEVSLTEFKIIKCLCLLSFLFILFNIHISLLYIYYLLL